MGELRSLKESDAHPVLDSAGGPTGAQQTPPPGEPPPGPRQRCPAEEAEGAFLAFFR